MPVNRRWVWWACIAIAGWLVTPAFAQSPAETAVAEAPAKTGRRPFCWKIEHNGSAASYLLGSLHVAKPELYPLPDALECAFTKAEVLVVEADPATAEDPAFLVQILQRVLDTADRPLAEGLSEEAVKKLAAVLKTLKLKREIVERFEPWYVAQMISVLEMSRLGVDLTSGVDLHFINQARDKVPIIELEGAANQLDFFDKFTDEEQSLLLEYTLIDLERIGSMMDDMTRAWQTGDAGQMEELLFGYLEESAGLEKAFDRIFGERNRAMATRIRELLAGGKSCFIIVGAGHLVGEDGLLELLDDEETVLTQLPVSDEE